jgi:hypothetical protein
VHYTYVEAWSVLGVILPEGTQSYEIGHSDCCRFVLTRDSNALLTIIDRGFAIGNFMLGDGGLAKLEYDDTALPSKIEEIQAERKSKIMGQAVLIVEAQGDTEASLREPYREFDEFIVTFEAIDEDNVEKLVKVHRSDIEAMKVALALESEVPLKFYKLSSGVYFTDEGDKTIYSISFSVQGSAFSSAKLTSDGANRISTRYNLLRQARDMDKLKQLFSLMADYENTPLLAFISGWTALEILINKLFNIYKEVLTNEEDPSVRKEFIKRKNKNIKEADEYTLMDKFILSVLKLFPNDVEDDCEQFSKLKKLRNSIHNKEFSEPHLPVSELATFLRKYLHAYMR